MEAKQGKQARQRRKHTEEFRAGAVRLVLQEGRSVAEVARDLDVHRSLLDTWVRQARVDAGKGPRAALTTAERDELSALRKKVRVLEMERALLKKAAPPSSSAPPARGRSSPHDADARTGNPQVVSLPPCPPQPTTDAQEVTEQAIRRR